MSRCMNQNIWMKAYQEGQKFYRTPEGFQVRTGKDSRVKLFSSACPYNAGTVRYDGFRQGYNSQCYHDGERI